MEAETPNQFKRIALVIGSGGTKCAAALGLWQVFQRESLEISMAVGSSGGSMYAALMAMGHTPQVAQEKTLNLWTHDLMKGYRSNLRAALTGESRFTERSGLIDDQRVLDRLRSVYGACTFADTRIPLHIVSTDLYSGESVVHTTGKIVDAIRASIAMPMILPPWQIGRRWLVDGAVSSPLPIDVAIKERADIIVAMGFELPVRPRMRSYTQVMSHFNRLYMNNILRTSFAFHNLAHHAEVIPVLPELEQSIGAFDSDQIPYVISQGARAAEEHLPYICRLLDAAQ